LAADEPTAMHAVAAVHETANSPVVRPGMFTDGDWDQEVPFQTSAMV
jgi:hypothetical protein